ncbi:AraC family transcriptional regulator [Rhodococcus sp. HNM0569]|uniref:AraC family transcriptional regulator n=1 Tax=Rhodococcus sp. HNM0569 TaxID=2716340 RepID=UPI00146AAB1F|nr:AraC family transcriptional regulator [Rhodococcus sp. HNM0569]NLU82819.1 helix-turn-helix domain-containing protein [Rhodococcus sp. HNM0569]
MEPEPGGRGETTGPGSAQALHASNRILAAITDLWDHPRSPVSVAIMCRWAAEHGRSRDALLRGSGIEPASLTDVDALVEARQELAVIRNLVASAGRRPGLGVDLGRRYHLTAYGYLGYLLAASATVRETVQRGLHYALLTFAFATMTARVDDGRYVLTLEADDVPADIRHFVLERDMTAVVQIHRGIFPGADDPLVEIRLPLPAPADSAGETAYREYFGVPVLFGSPRAEIVYEGTYLDREPPMANEHAVQLMLAHCERIRAERLHSTGVAAQVRAHLLDLSSLDLTLDDVAARLHYAPRTLRRHLEHEGTTFRELVDEVRRIVADNLLREQSVPRYEIAHRLGYSDWSSVARARRRWQSR